MYDTMFTVEMLAAHLQLSTNTIRHYLMSGYLNGFKIGRFWRVTSDELAKFIATSSKTIK